MNSNPHKPTTCNSGEETLRLIASLPAPQGLEERVHKALGAAPQKGRVLAWPAGIGSRLSADNNWMRAAAAAAIVFVVVGGGWGVYSRVEQVQSGKVVVMPARVPASGGFAGAGAIRTPETLPGPKIGEHATPAGSKGASEQVSKGARERGTQPAKNAAVPKNPSARPSASQAAPQPVAR